MESDSESVEGDVQGPADSTPIQTRTLFHYFTPKPSAIKKVTTQESNKKPKSPQATNTEQKFEEMKSSSKKKRKTHLDGNSGEAPSAAPPEGEPEEGSATKKVKTDNPDDEPEPHKKPLNPISNFFSKITKDDYRKSCEKDLTAPQKVTVKAMVHCSDDDEAAAAGPSKTCRGGVRPKVKRKAKTGVNDADQIQVVSSEEVEENQENVQPKAPAAEKRTSKKIEVAPPAVPKNAFLINEELSVGDVDFFQRHCIETRDLMDVESNIPKSDPSTPSKQQVPTTPKISNRLFNKTRKGKRKKETKEEPPPEEEEEMVQDGPSLFKVKPEKVQVKPKRGGKKKEKKEKYQLTNGYDSDSVDLDILENLDRKTFGKKSHHADSGTEDETCFMALMNKPLINHEKKDDPDTKQHENLPDPSVEPVATIKEDDSIADITTDQSASKDSGDSKHDWNQLKATPKNNAFALLMSKQTKDTQQQNVPATTSLVPKKKGRPKKQQTSDSVEHKLDAADAIENSSSKEIVSKEKETTAVDEESDDDLKVDELNMAKLDEPALELTDDEKEADNEEMQAVDDLLQSSFSKLSKSAKKKQRFKLGLNGQIRENNQLDSDCDSTKGGDTDDVIVSAKGNVQIPSGSGDASIGSESQEKSCKADLSDAFGMFFDEVSKEPDENEVKSVEELLQDSFLKLASSAKKAKKDSKTKGLPQASEDNNKSEEEIEHQEPTRPKRSKSSKTSVDQPVPNSAFAKLMNAAAGHEDPVSSVPKRSKRGRPKKTLPEPEEEDANTDVNNKENISRVDSAYASLEVDQAQTQDEDMTTPPDGRRKSSRLKGKQEEEKKRQEILLIEAQQMDEDFVPSRRKRKNKRVESESEDSEIEVVEDTNHSKRRLASIFVKKSKPAPEDPAKVAARKAFLSSSVPDSLRSQLKEAEELAAAWLHSTHFYFPQISHVRQEGSGCDMWDLDKDFSLQCVRRLEFDTTEIPEWKPFMGLAAAQPDSQMLPILPRLVMEEICSVLRGKSEDDLAAFRTYMERKLESDILDEEARSKNLSLNEIEEQRTMRSGRKGRNRIKLSKKKSKEIDEPASKPMSYDPWRPTSMLWTMKYSPRSGDEVIGNHLAVGRMRAWLSEWHTSAAAAAAAASQSSADSSFCDSSEAASECSDYSDGRDCAEVSSNNTALVCGPTGVGKTATVYALAREMGFKVLEVNASSNRNGKSVLANLREATQSHSVRNKDKNSQQLLVAALSQQQNSQKSSTVAGGSRSNAKTLILFEDVDVVFDDYDDGFIAAVITMISTSKRPIICTTSANSYASKSNGLSKHINKIFTFEPVDPTATARDIEMLALAEGFHLRTEDLVHLVEDRNGGRVSSSIHALQTLLMSSVQHQHVSRNNPDFEEVLKDGERDLQLVPSPLFDKREKTQDDRSITEVTTLAMRQQLMREVSSRCDGQILNFPLKETDNISGHLTLKSAQDGPSHAQSAVNQDIAASNLFDIGFHHQQTHASSLGTRISLDALPFLREIARMEQRRQSEQGKAKGRGNRSRFMHYFDSQEVYLQPPTLVTMCKSFQKS